MSDNTEPKENIKDSSDQIQDSLFKNRVIIISEAIDSKIAKKVIANLLSLDYADSSLPITIYQNSPGG